MGRRGPKPADSKLKLLKGERADRMPSGKAPDPKGLPAPPEYLDDVAGAEWARILPELAEAGVLSRVDGAGLALYCIVFSRWQLALADIARAGLIASTALGGPKANPTVAMAAQCEAQMHRLLAEFGATPASRGRVKVPEKPPEDPLEKLLASRRKA